MKKLFSFVAAIAIGVAATAQYVELPEPMLDRDSKTMMNTLMERHSVREFGKEPLSIEEISTLCWAACGITRDGNHITSPTAMNRQEIRLFVFTEEGVFEYLPKKNALAIVSKEDARELFVSNGASDQPSNDKAGKKGKKGKKGKDAEQSQPKRSFGQDFVLEAPVTLLMVIDLDRLGMTDDRGKTMGYLDAGIVSENVNLYCEAVKLATVPRVTMDVARIKTLLKLNDHQIPAINNTVGYPR